MSIECRRSRWLSARAVKLHLLAALVVPLCLLAGYWQADRALSGNTLSYVYAVEWPAFAALGVWGWWQLLHAPAEGEGPDPAPRMPPDPPRWDPATESEALRRYNQALQQLDRADRTKRR